MPLFASEGGNETSGERAWEAFHVAHPEVYTLLVVLTRQAAASKQQFSISTLWSVVHYTLVRAGVPVDLEGSRFAPLYARQIMAREADLEGYFLTRRRRADTASEDVHGS